jgi:mono/diheme cytochrome c family protein
MRFLLVALALAVGCGKNDKPPPPSSGRPGAPTESGPGGKHPNVAVQDPNEPDQAHKMFQMVCAVCHGMEGKGDGPGAENLSPKPRDYTDAKWQATVTDDDLKKTIVMGGAAIGKSAAMPAQPQLKDQPEVLDGLVMIIRGFAKK